jgi:hypothetical protein
MTVLTRPSLVTDGTEPHILPAESGYEPNLRLLAVGLATAQGVGVPV